jgi:hypothetical protein
MCSLDVAIGTYVTAVFIARSACGFFIATSITNCVVVTITSAYGTYGLADALTSARNHLVAVEDAYGLAAVSAGALVTAVGVTSSCDLFTTFSSAKCIEAAITSWYGTYGLTFVVASARGFVVAATDV